MNYFIQLEGELFEAVQRNAVFVDSKTFVDSVPLYKPEAIMKRYQKEKDTAGFNLELFVKANFKLPEPFVASDEYKLSTNSLEAYISSLWPRLKRSPAMQEAHSTLIPLAYPYLVPGGRFGEIYYWDSYFTLLGLVEDDSVSERFEILENMLKNLVQVQATVGHIPNGNRLYFKTRSQPPYLSLMVELLLETTCRSKEAKQGVAKAYLPALEKEHKFWMQTERSVEHKGATLNHYWDASTTPREEAYKEDLETAEQSERDAATIYRDLRAGAESGWDFSCRWCMNPHDLSTIEATKILPVDLNCLLYKLELTLGDLHAFIGDTKKNAHYQGLAEQRKEAINATFWNVEKQFYFDFHIKAKPMSIFSLAAVMPLFVSIASPEQAEHVKDMLMTQFLKEGGLVSTLENTGQQWDAPNGWAPLQWLAIKGLLNYGYEQEAKEIATRWLKTIRTNFAKDKKLLEKYNVETPMHTAGGGEYSVQEGFGWTNGVTLKLLKMYNCISTTYCTKT